jgi:hypothetical protein
MAMLQHVIKLKRTSEANKITMELAINIQSGHQLQLIGLHI